ncbi:hypothetical protein TNCV_4085141 [Trichonephila clavipes]|nr:hypothetical protein TNCV_4085141 [Trichonephila clavipes]
MYECRLRQFVDVCCALDCVQGCLYTESPLTTNQRRVRLQWAHEHRAWQADRHQVAFSVESRFNLWDPESRVRVRR